MRRLTWLLIALAACSKSEDAPKSTVTPPATATATATATASATPTPTATSVPTDIPKLPERRAEDLVPKDEAIAGSLLVDVPSSEKSADGYRYQVPAGFRPMTDPTSGPWTGKVKGVSEEATLTIYATRIKFKGDVDTLAANESKDIQTSGGKVELTGPVLVWIAGRSEPARARRLLGRFDGKLDYRVLVVRAPNAYIFHCQAPPISATGADAWTNIGVECMARGTTFHVAPPPVH